MIIAIDYDDTFTKDPDLWTVFIDTAIISGHTVIMATQRVEPWMTEPRQVAEILDIPLVFGSLPKREACLMAGYNVDVWIDDTPEGILSERFYQGS